MLVIIGCIIDKITNTDITETKLINRYPISRLQYRCILTTLMSCYYTVIKQSDSVFLLPSLMHQVTLPTQTPCTYVWLLFVNDLLMFVGTGGIN